MRITKTNGDVIILPSFVEEYTYMKKGGLIRKSSTTNIPEEYIYRFNQFAQMNKVC